jgi:predicted ATPase/DNA-binding winged helix-turn-helix (wHTH) protein
MEGTNEIKFGQFRLDLANECLWRGTQAISLRPKAFAVLKLLAENPHQLVNKQQVLDAVWPGTFVGDAVLKDNIRQIREALGDDAEDPIYIETAHRRGYRFIGATPGSSRDQAPTPDFPAIPAGGPEESPSKEPVLGRETELAILRASLDQTLVGRRQTVFIAGEPGIGKTALVQAFLRQAAGSAQIVIARGQCLEQYGAGEAYLPVLDGLSRLCRSARGARMLAFLRQHAPSWLVQMPSLLSPAETANLHAQALGVTRERMLREVANAIEAFTAESPLLLVLEDIHWSDYSTLDLVSYLTHRRDHARLMIIATYRPVDVILNEHPLKSVKREMQAHNLCREIALECLSEETVREYLNARFAIHELPKKFAGVVFTRTEGNPLFMVNLIDYLCDQELIAQEEGRWKLRAQISEVEKEVPASVRQLIERQLDRLTSEEREVLDGASVGGMEFSTLAIAAGIEKPVERVEEHCEELARRHQFLSPAWTVELPNGMIASRRRFIHVLYRDVPYHLLPPLRRSQIHHRIAESETAVYGTRACEIAAELAMHYEQSRDWEHALEHTTQAASNASWKSAHHEAAELAKRGLAMQKFLPKSVERDRREIVLRAILSASLMALNGFASVEVEQVYTDGRQLFEQSIPSAQLFNVLYLHGISTMVGGKLWAPEGMELK